MKNSVSTDYVDKLILCAICSVVFYPLIPPIHIRFSEHTLKVFELWGTVLTIIGALFTVLGVRVNAIENEEIKALFQSPTKELKVMAKMFDTASRFASFGAFFIAAGGVLLVLRLVSLDK